MTGKVLGKVLAGRRVLIARPEEKARELSQCLVAMGAESEVLPAIEIQVMDLEPLQRQYLLELDQYSHVIAVSAHGARIGLEWIDQFWPQLPLQQQFYAIGAATKGVFKTWDIPVMVPVHGETSEDLLQLDSLQDLAGQRVLLLKGKGGRDLITRTLKTRGARVDEVETYQRTLPAYTDTVLQQKLVDFDPQYLVTLSGDTLTNLCALAAQISVNLEDKVVLVPSKRVANLARERGFKLVYVPESLKPIDIVRCIATSQETARK